MYISWQTLVTAGSVLAAFTAIVTLYNKILRWVDHQSEQDSSLTKLKQEHRKDIGDLQKEQTLIVFGLLSCLKGLQEQGCNGPVTAGIDKLERHLNLKAHDQNED